MSLRRGGHLPAEAPRVGYPARYVGTVYTASLAVNQIASFYPEDEAVELYELEGRPPPHSSSDFAVSPDGRWMVGTTELTGFGFRIRSRSSARHEPGGYHCGKRRSMASRLHTGRTLGLRGQQLGQHGQRDRHGDPRTLAKVIEGDWARAAPRSRHYHRTDALPTSPAETSRCPRTKAEPDTCTRRATTWATTPGRARS